MHRLSMLRAFFLGMMEFRDDLTTSFDDLDLSDAYDNGREWAHRLTMRRFDHY
jgi:hypothetical protein